MTDRQFVLKYYKNAILDFNVRPINTMRSVTFYYIRDGFLGKILGRGDIRSSAWRNAKNNIIKITHEPRIKHR